MIDAGKLNRRIQIQRLSTTKDAAGESTEWDTIHTCWAGVAVQNSQLVYETAQFVSQATYKVTIRYPHSISIDPSCRVVYGSHTFEIKAVLNPDQRNEQLQLICYVINDAQ